MIADCDETSCIFWRVAQHLDIEPVQAGCALQHFELLGEEGSELAAWLLSVKERVERECEGKAT